MKNAGKVVWIIDGKIKEMGGFRSVVKDVVEMAHREHVTKTYWWSASSDNTKFSDLDIYDSECGALEHIGHWAPHNDEFEQYAQNERLLILGDVPQSVRNALSAMNPHYMSFYGGFTKDKPIDADQHSDVIWSFEGHITNKEMFREAMERLTPITHAERGCVMYWWCLDEQGRFFILERYLNSDAAMIHMRNSAKYGKLFFGSTQIAAFTIYSTITAELANVVSELNPERMKFVAGFSR